MKLGVHDYFLLIGIGVFLFNFGGSQCVNIEVAGQADSFYYLFCETISILGLFLGTHGILKIWEVARANVKALHEREECEWE